MKFLVAAGPSHRDAVAAATESPRSTVYDSLARLRRKKKVVYRREMTGKTGRPRTMWAAAAEVEKDGKRPDGGSDT